MSSAPTRGYPARQPPRPNVVYVPLPGAYPRTHVPYLYAMPAPQQNKVRPDTLAPHMDAKGKAIHVDLRGKEYKDRDDLRVCWGYSLLAKPVKDVQLVCREFPWAIKLKGEWVTCGLVWKSVHGALRERITDAEWGFIARDGSRKRVVEKAMKKRLEENPRDVAVPLRVDYLGDLTVFKGLEKDDEFVEKFLMPGTDKWETWVIRLGRK